MARRFCSSITSRSFGHVALYLGLKDTQYHFDELLRNADRLDSELLNGLHGPPSQRPGRDRVARNVGHGRTRPRATSWSRVMDFLRREYDYVLIDSPVCNEASKKLPHRPVRRGLHRFDPGRGLAARPGAAGGDTLTLNESATKQAASGGATAPPHPTRSRRPDREDGALPHLGRRPQQLLRAACAPSTMASRSRRSAAVRVQPVALALGQPDRQRSQRSRAFRGKKKLFAFLH